QPRHEHRQQQHEAAQQQQPVELLDRLEFGAHHPRAQRRAHAQEHHVPQQEVERPDLQLLGHRDRTRAHHHHAQRRQRHRGADQTRVVAPVDVVDAGGLARLRAVEAFHHRTFSVASPTSTRITEMIQKRTITRGSGQPLSSKWWWIGAIRNTRLPVSLNDATWIITDRVSMTKMPPMITSTSSWRTMTAMVRSEEH